LYQEHQQTAAAAVMRSSSSSSVHLLQALNDTFACKYLQMHVLQLPAVQCISMSLQSAQLLVCMSAAAAAKLS
jgi:hypothetical protein